MHRSEHVRRNFDSKLRRVLRWSLFGAVACHPIAQAMAQCEYDIEIIQSHDCDAGGFPISAGFEALNVNDHGWVVGEADLCSDTTFCRPAIWKPGWIESAELPIPSWFVNGDVFDINNNGVVLCAGSGLPDVGFRPFLINADNTIEVFDALTPDATHAQGLAMNDHGVVVGYSDGGPDETRRACMWKNGEIFLLDTPRGEDSIARSVDEVGNIYGHIGTSWTDDILPVVWHPDGSMTELPIPQGMFDGRAVDGISEGVAIGSVRVPGDSSSGDPIPMMWDHGRAVELAMLDEHYIGGAMTVNDHGQIFGQMFSDNGEHCQVMWTQQHGLLELFDLLAPHVDAIQVSVAEDANNRGQFLASVRPTEGSWNQALWTPIEFPDGDISADCRVDHYDLLKVISNWGLAHPVADIDHSGTVDVDDLLAVLSNWTG